MSVRASRWLFWVAALFVVPVPFFLVERGLVPVARLLQISGVVLSLMVTEGTQGQVVTLIALLLGQAIGFMALLWLAALAFSRMLARFSSRVRLAATLLVVLAAVLVTSAVDVYRTPFSARSLSANLLRVYE